MRPKRRVAVLGANEISRRVWCFVLDVWGYAVFPAETPGELRRIVEAGPLSAVVAVLPGPRGREELRRAQRLGTPVMSLDVRANAVASCANVSLSVKAMPMEVRQTLKLLAMRKRGPQKMAAPLVDVDAGKTKVG